MMGTNVVAAKLAHFIDNGQVDSSHAVATARVGAANAEAAIYGSAPWGPRRLAVEEALGAVRTAVYATLDLPRCPGDSTYGPFRVVYDPMPGVRPPIVLPHNSAAAYAPAGVILEADLSADVAAWEQRGSLATALRGLTAAAHDPAQWPTLLAAEDPTSAIEQDLIEVVVRDGKRPFATVRSVRVAEADFDAVMDVYLRNLSKSGTVELDDVEKAASRVAEAHVGGVLTLELL